MPCARALLADGSAPLRECEPRLAEAPRDGPRYGAPRPAGVVTAASQVLGVLEAVRAARDDVFRISIA